MKTDTIHISDSMKRNVRDELTTTKTLRGEVEIQELDQSTKKIISSTKKNNLIVFGGREWLLRKAFGSNIEGSNVSDYNKTLNWFAVGTGGGEPGNPLQAGSTYGQNTELAQITRLRTDLVDGDDAYSLYGSVEDGDHGFYKRFSSVTMREDRANPYQSQGNTLYPALIAEIRIELSSDDATGGGTYEDLNEAGLFVSDPDLTDPGSEESSTAASSDPIDVIKVVKDNNYTIYTLDTEDLDETTGTDYFGIGDSISVSRITGTNNTISEDTPGLIVDIFKGNNGNKAYIVVDKIDGVDEPEISAGAMSAVLINRVQKQYEMFARVTFSTIRKTQNREIVFLWRIFF